MFLGNICISAILKYFGHKYLYKTDISTETSQDAELEILAIKYS